MNPNYIEELNNAKRLAYALFQRKDDEEVIKQLAVILNYIPEQLKIDIEDLYLNLPSYEE